MPKEDTHDEDPYEIGYGKPPKQTRFKPGQSGNPKGRSKKKRPTTVNGMIGATLHEQVTISDGRRKSYLELIVMRMIKDLAEGKVKQWIPVLNYLEQFDPRVEFVPTDDDSANFADLLNRIKAGGDGEGS